MVKDEPVSWKRSRRGRISNTAELKNWSPDSIIYYLPNTEQDLEIICTEFTLELIDYLLAIRNKNISYWTITWGWIIIEEIWRMLHHRTLAENKILSISCWLWVLRDQTQHIVKVSPLVFEIIIVQPKCLITPRAINVAFSGGSQGRAGTVDGPSGIPLGKR